MVGACALSASALLAGACSAPQRFESATTDQRADATEEHTKEPNGTEPSETQQEPEETSQAESPSSDDAAQTGVASESEAISATSTTPGTDERPSSTEDSATSPSTSDGDGSSGSGHEATSSDEGVTTSGAASEATAVDATTSEAATDETAASSGTSAPETGASSPESTSAGVPSSEPGLPDECPDHEQQVAGPCGCGHEPDPRCKALSDALLHRYAIVSHGVEGQYPASIPDSVGSADADVHDSRFDWDGSLLLDGDDSYMQFPSGLLSSRDEVTLDLWVKWWGGSDNQRLLNFGHAPGSNDAPDNFLSISPSGGNGVLTVQYRTNPDERADKLEADYSLPTSDLHHLTLVIRPESFELYVNGESVGDVETLHHLHDLEDTDNWLGRALYDNYPLYNGALYEFRVFKRALSDDEVTKMDEVGLDLP